MSSQKYEAYHFKTKIVLIFGKSFGIYFSIFQNNLFPLKQQQSFIVNIDRNSIWNERRSSHNYI